MRRVLSQIIAITLTNLQTIRERKVASIVAVIGIAGVVAILVGVLSMREGFKATLDQAGADDVAIIMRRGSGAEMSSALTLDQTRLIAGASAVVREQGQPLASPELYVIIDVPIKRTGTSANVPLRGITPMAPRLRQQFRLTQGRMFVPGRFEVIVGRGTRSEFSGIEVGQKVRWGSTVWEVVGEFADGGSVAESEIWTDATVLQGAYRRGSTFQSVRLQLSEPRAIEQLKTQLAADPRLSVNVRSEREFYSEQSRALSTMINSVGFTVALLMGLGALFGALNTMYASVSARTREIATLRAIGFGAWPVVISVLVEAMFLGLIGGLIGAVVAYLGFNGIRASTLNFNSFSQVTFAFAVTPKLLIQGLSYALVLSFVGGIMPGIRAAKLPIVSGLRQL